MKERAKVGQPQEDSSVRVSSRFTDCYGGGAFSVERHTSEILGGNRGFSRDKPSGRLASRYSKGH